MYLISNIQKTVTKYFSIQPKKKNSNYIPNNNTEITLTM